MSTQVIVTLTNGKTVRAVNYRMASYAVPSPSVPASPNPFTGGMYHLEARNGWVDYLADDVQNISVISGAFT